VPHQMPGVVASTGTVFQSDARKSSDSGFQLHNSLTQRQEQHRQLQQQNDTWKKMLNELALPRSRTEISEEVLTIPVLYPMEFQGENT